MIRTIARKEFLELWRDGRFRAAWIITLALLMASLLLGYRGWSEVRAQREVAQRTMRAQWLHQGEKSPHAAAHYGVYALRPAPALSSAEPGILPYTGVAVWLEAHKQNDFQNRPARDATAVSRFGALSAALVMQVLLPLLIVLLSFGAFAAERENGTLRQVLSLGVPRTTWALGKMLGIAAALGVLLVPAILVGVTALALASGATSLAEALPRMVLMGAGYALYFGAIIGLSLAVSAWARSARAALVVLLGFWIGNSLLLPRAASDLARTLYPTPSAFEFTEGVEKDIKNGIGNDGSQEERLQQLEARTLRQYKVAKVEDLPVAFRGLTLQAGEDYGDKVFDRRYGALWNTIERQNAVYDWISLGAPMLAARSWSMALAGTDWQQQRHFANQAEAHRRLIQKTMNDAIFHSSSTDGLGLEGADLWARVPAFRAQPLGLSAAIGSRWPALGVLALWCALGVGAALWSANRLRAQ